MKIKFVCSMLLIGTAAVSNNFVHAQTQSDQEQIFLTRSSEAGLAEIKQSQLALEKSTDPQVRDFAQKMITDHTALADKMKPFAGKYTVTPVDKVTSEHQAELDKLSTLSGKAFDKEYIASMETDHRAALILFDDERGTSKDKALQASADEAYATVEMHLKMADKLADKLGVPVPNDAPNP